MCPTCSKRRCHVQLAGESLVNVTGETVKKYLLECSVIKPLHIIKRAEQSFALVHFPTENDAATFYYLYCKQKKGICSRLEDVEVNPSLIDNHPVKYANLKVLASTSTTTYRCTSTTTCRCTSTTSTTSTSTEATSSTSTEATSTEATTPTSTTSTNDEELDVCLEELKRKYTNALKRKEEEREKILEDISRLRKKLRYLEEMQNL